MKIWRYEDLLRCARGLVREADLIPRSSLKGLCPGEVFDEDYWAEHLPFQKDELKIVSPLRSIYTPLMKSRTVSQPGFKVRFDFPKCRGEDMLTNVLSYCKEYPDHAQIVVHNKSKRLCVHRFLESKEMLHLLTDTVAGEERERSLLADVLLEKSLDGRNFVADFNEPLKPEAVGFYLAIEVLLPWCLRPQLNDMIDAKATNLQIAKAFMIPEFVVRHIRSVMFGGKNYLGVSYEWNRTISVSVPANDTF